MINSLINSLINYGLKNKLLEESDVIFSTNLLLSLFELNKFTRDKDEPVLPIDILLEKLCDYASEKCILVEDNIIYRDLFDTEIMNTIIGRPSEINRKFYDLYKTNTDLATNYFYDLAIKSNYIRENRIKKNICWKSPTKYGLLDMTINLSKPEKDPKMIEKALKLEKSSYPECLLCYENVGFGGNINHPNRRNLRVIPVILNNEKWYFQYSPYVYYNEHCIVFKEEHVPMFVNDITLKRLLEFVEMYPKYFLGSNAGLPIVGGSILTHDHYQGGKYRFAIVDAKVRKSYKLSTFSDVDIEYLVWPLDVIRLKSYNKDSILALSKIILYSWQDYNDLDNDIISHTEGILHNAITPIVRFNDDKYEMDIVLRNNRTTSDYPYGLFHPTVDLHHIKKENIGLIEVMGLAVLPARLKNELSQLADIWIGKTSYDAIENNDLVKHKVWFNEIKDKYYIVNTDNVMSLLYREVGYVFEKVLECCSVFKKTDKVKAMNRFFKEIGGKND